MANKNTYRSDGRKTDRKNLTFFSTLALSLLVFGGLTYHFRAFIFGEKRSVSIIGTQTLSRVQNIVVNKSEIDAATADLAGLLRQVRMAPIFSADGKTVQGFSVNQIAPNSIFEKLGLAKGDLVLGINDKKLFSPDDAMSIYNIIKSSDTVEVNIQRDGQPLTLNYQIGDRSEQ